MLIKLKKVYQMGIIKLMFIAGLPGFKAALVKRYAGINVESHVLNYITNPNMKMWAHNYFRVTEYPIIKIEQYLNSTQPKNLPAPKNARNNKDN